MPDAAEPLELALPRALGASDVRETHCSWVFLTGERAYKLKKPVRFGFLDLTSPEARRRACEEEVRVNGELAPEVVLGSRAVVRDGAAYRLGAPDDPAAIDWVVEMRRYDERRTMAALAARGELTPADAAAVGRRIAAFHATARPAGPGAFADLLAAQWAGNLDELAPVAGAEHADAISALRAFATAFLTGRSTELELRARAGLVREGHGDLRADHVVLDGGVTIVDRLEFDVSLREVDVADDLAFLVMDLEAHGVRWAADAVVAAYRAAGGDAGDDRLVAFYAAYRALVRAKVELLRAAQLPPEPERSRSRDRAAGLVRLAEHLAWRARSQPLLVICGPPASGKSSLAAELSTRTRVPVLSSDAIRKELLGVPAGDRAPAEAYTPSRREQVYAELARRLHDLPAGDGAIVDATFADRWVRARLSESLDDIRRRTLRWVECHAPLTTLMARAADRSPRDARGSDAGPAVAARLGLTFEPLDEMGDDRRLVVDTTQPIAATVRRVGAWLDSTPPHQSVVLHSPTSNIARAGPAARTDGTEPREP